MYKLLRVHASLSAPGQIGHSKGSGGTLRAAPAAQKVPRVSELARRRRAQLSRPSLAFARSMPDVHRDGLKRTTKKRNFFYNLIDFFRFAAARRRDSKSDYISAVSRAPCFHRCCLHGPIACGWECCKGSLYNPMRERVQPMVCQPDFVRFKPRDQPETGLHKKPGAMRARFFCLSLI